ncbi:MAG: hypothetical protein ACFFCB_03835 [Candidatus Odinarchaeota archaeon]
MSIFLVHTDIDGIVTLMKAGQRESEGEFVGGFVVGKFSGSLGGYLYWTVRKAVDFDLFPQATTIPNSGFQAQRSNLTLSFMLKGIDF